MSAFISLITLLLPSIIKVIEFFINKKTESEELKKKFISFVDEIDKHVSVDLRSKYLKQIEKLNEELRLEEEQQKKVLEQHANTKEAYENLLKEKEIKNG